MVVLVGVGSRLLYVVTLAFSDSLSLVLLATALGSLRRMDQYSAQSFLAKQVAHRHLPPTSPTISLHVFQVPNGEVGKLLAFVGIAFNLGVLTGNAGGGWLYYATVTAFPVSAYVAAAALMTASWLTMLLVHFLHRNEQGRGKAK